MKVNVKYIGIRLFLAFIWLLFIEGGKLSEHYIYIGEFGGVKTWVNKKIDLSIYTKEQKETIKHIEITNYQSWEPYYKVRPKTKIDFNINCN